jgi:hypothetical protein
MNDVFLLPGTPRRVAKVLRTQTLGGQSLDAATQGRLVQRALLFHEALRDRGVRIVGVDKSLLSEGILIYDQAPPYALADLRRMAREQPSNPVRQLAVRRAEEHIRLERQKIARIDDDLMAINEGRFNRRLSSREDSNDPDSEVIRGADVGSGNDSFLFDINGENGVLADW